MVPRHQRRRRSLFDFFIAIADDCGKRLVTRTETAEYDTSQLPAGSFCQVDTFIIDDRIYININMTKCPSFGVGVVQDRYFCKLTATVRC